MKKFFIVAVALLCLAGTAVAQRHIEFRWRGIYFVGDASYGINLNRSTDEFSVRGDTLAAFMPSMSVGYQFRKEAAVGAGFTYVADQTGAFEQLPVFVELRSHFLRSRWTPYTVLQAGYCVPLGSSSEPMPISTKIDEGGLYLGVGLGYRFAISRNTALAVHLDYRLMQSNRVIYSSVTGESLLPEAVSLHTISGGLSFYFGN